MKSKIIKRIAGISSIGLAGVLVVGTILNTILAVEAEETLFGIESLIQDVQARETPYRILEIVPDEKAAEIGYYIPGYEPVLSSREEGTGVWSDWVDGLKQYKTYEERSEYMENLNLELQEFYALRGFSGSVPVTYQGYAESEEPANGYAELAFDTEVRTGYFKQYEGGSDTERYTLDFEYVGNVDESDVIANMTTQYYYVKEATRITSSMFDSLTDGTVLYGFTEQSGANRFEEVGTWGELKSTIVDESVSGGDASSGEDASVSDGNASVSGGDGDTETAPEDLTDYYLIHMERWSQGATLDYLALYAVKTFEKADDGAYEFENTEDGFEYQFNTDSIYYKGGFVNNEWFHTNVLNMQPGQTESFPTEVITLTVSELNAMAELPAFDMLYLNSGMQAFADSEVIRPYSVGESVSSGDAVAQGNDMDDVYLDLFADVIKYAKPCIVDASILYYTDEQGGLRSNASLSDANIFRLAAMFLQKSPKNYYENVILNEEEYDVVTLLANMVSDTDKNFVVEQTYCFYAPTTLIGPEFAEVTIYKEGQPVTAEAAEGFQAVLDEIISENLNREADTSGDYKQLPTDASQATAVRHIINYTNRRQIVVKESIRVLEIQPAKSSTPDLTAEEIMTWAPQVKEVQIDTMTTAEFIGKIEDINEIYDLVYIGTDKDYLNTVSGTNEITTVATNLQNGGFENELSSWSAWGTAAATTEAADVHSGGGALKLSSSTVTQFFEVQAGRTYKLTAWGKVGGSNTRGTLGIDLASGNTDDDVTGRAGEVEFTTGTYTEKSFTFTAVEGTTHFKVYAWTGAEALYLDDIRIEEVVTNESATAAGSTVFNDSSMDGLIYFHTGDLRYSAMELAGQLDTEYVDGKNRTDNVYYYNPVRYGGNDITDDKKDALMSFLNASYPIIISDEVFESAATLFKDTDWAGYSVNLDPGSYTMSQLNALGVANDDITSIKVSEGYQVTIYWDDNYGGASETFTGDVCLDKLGSDLDWNDELSSIKVTEVDGQADLRTRKIDEDHIDNSSYMYEFIKDAMGKTNFYARSEMSADSPMFQFYLNRPKVSLDNVTANGKNPEGEVIGINPGANDKYVLEYKFTILNEGAASADTRYECELFVDVNADGKYSTGEELEDIAITHNGKAVSYNNLYAGREYVLRRTVPDGYKGVLPWKVQVSQTNNPNIHNGVTGYTKLQGLDTEELDILQICRDPVTEGDPGTWWGGANEVFFNLEEKIANDADIYHILIYGGTYDGVYYPGIADDFTINVDFMHISEFEAEFAENPNMLDDYNMLILGFSDAYGNISGTDTSGPIGAIIDFIESGKSVLFAHDTVSYFNYEQYRTDANGDTVARRGAVSHKDTSQTKLTNQYHNSYNLAKYIRGLVGMDRYGITSAAEQNVIEELNIVARLRSGQGLNAAVDTGLWGKLMGLSKDVAYVPKSGKTETTGLVQGYTYSIINAKDQNTSGGRHETFTADQTGNGDFTNTYLNLDYGTVYYHDYSADDGEIKDNYNAEVSNLWVTKVNSGQITDYPYKLSDKFMVSNTHAQYYQLDFMADDDFDDQSDLVVWYCLGHRTNANGGDQETIYSASPNDVSNNYYIYNKGNITYTGVGHAGNKSTVDEAKLFINTMIASYSAGTKNPTISILSDGTGNAQEINSTYSYYDGSNYDSEGNKLSFDDVETTQSGSEDTAKLYFTVSDPNFVKGERKMSVRLYYEVAAGTEGSQDIVYEGKTITVKELTREIYNASTGKKEEDLDNLASGGIYYALIDKSLMGDYETRFSVYFEAQSTITTYKRIIQTDKAYNRFDYTRVQLFDLK